MLTFFKKTRLSINLTILKMKKMNAIVLFVGLIFTFSCSDTDQVLIENFNDTTKSTEEEYLYQLDILYVGTVTRINELKEQKQALASKVARKDRTALKGLERTQKEIEKLVQFKDYLLGIRGPKGPKPIVLPPMGCLVESNCDPTRFLQNIKGIVLMKEVKTTSIVVRDAKHNIVGEGGDIGKDAYGQRYMELQSDLKGSGQLEITVITQEFGEIRTKIPVQKK